MKRKLSLGDAAIAEQQCRKCSPQRRPKRIRNASTPPPTTRARAACPSVEETTNSTPRSENAVKLWLESVSVSESPADAEEVSQHIAMSASDAASTRRPRSAATSRSRSSSPSKPSSQNYRAQVLSRVHIRIDADVSDTTKSRLVPPVSMVHRSPAVTQVAQDLQQGARELVQRSTANEAEWQALLEAAIKCLFRELDVQLCCLPNRGLSQLSTATGHGGS
jgi:hypothetical protein